MESFVEKPNIKNKSLKERLLSKRKKIGAKAMDIINEFISSKHIIDEKLNAKFLKRGLDKAAKEYRRKWMEMHKEEIELSDKWKLDDKSQQRIIQHGYAVE